MKTGQLSESKDQEIRILLFRLRHEKFGIDVWNVREIAKIVDITTIYEPTGLIKGVFNLRGQIITAVDAAKQFGFAAQETFPQTTRTVIVEFKDRIIGLVVDEVLDVLTIPYDQIDLVPGVIQTEIKREYIKGVSKAEEQPFILLDPEKIMRY